MATSTAKSHRVPFFVPMFNPVIAILLGLGIPLGPITLLTVRGRKTGRLYTTPVAIFQRDGRRWLFSTFGEVSWVRNLRASGEAILGRGRRRLAYAAVELSPEDAALIIKEGVAPYLGSPVAALVLRGRLDVTPDSSLNDFIKEARRHPVFELR